MTRENFNKQWLALIAAFPSERITVETQDIYFGLLQEIPDDLWEHGVRKILKGNRFFPTINEIGAACCGEQKEQVVWKEDPWRERQHYTERLPEIPWTRNLERILQERKAIEAPVEQQKIEPPEKPDYVQRGNPVAVGELLKDFGKKLDRKQAEKEKEREVARQKKREEAKEKLDKQAKLLGVE